MRRHLLPIALALSLGANLYLWFARSSAAAPAPPPPPTIVTPTPSTPSRSAHVPARKIRTRPPPDDRGDLEQRILRAEARIEELLPVQHKYKRDPRSEPTEVAVRPGLDRILTPAAYTVECHGRVCKIAIGEAAPSDWQSALQTSPERGWFSTIAFLGGEVYVELAPPERLGAGIVHAIRIAFELSNDTAACLAANAQRGELTITIRFDPSTRRLRSEVGGSLAAATVGACLRGVLDEVLAKTVVPAGLTSVLEAPWTFSLPTPR
jgi:hypothetical protein